jgi:hypothetical protein
MWKNESPEVIQQYKDTAAKAMEVWKEEMIKWVKTRPVADRAELMGRFKLYDNAPTKRKRDESNKIKSEDAGKKKAITLVKLSDELSSEEQTPSKKKKSFSAQLNYDSTSTVDQSPQKKKKKNNESASQSSENDTKEGTSPKKNSIKEQLASIGPYPSQTTAHYFMTTKCAGMDTKKVAKKYKKLSKGQKKELFKEMTAIKNLYLANIKSHATNLDYSKIMKFHQKNKAAQENDITWHNSADTDNPNDSDSSDDSDDS